MRSEDSRFFCTVAMSSREQSYPYCCVLDLGHVFKCPATYLSNDKSGTSTSGNKFLCLVQPLWEFNFLIFFFPLSYFLNFKKRKLTITLPILSNWFVLWLIITSFLSSLTQVLVSHLPSCYPQAFAWFYNTVQNKTNLVML